jgi:hypothetical protein
MARDVVCGMEVTSSGRLGRANARAVPSTSARRAANGASRQIRRDTVTRERRTKMPLISCRYSSVKAARVCARTWAAEIVSSDDDGDGRGSNREPWRWP